MISQETKQRILDATRIEDVIGDFVSLKKRGANHIGCCPFHNEKTPSFYVSPSKGIYKCFGCGEAGDVVKFLMKHEHYTYPEALRWLADKYHVDIKEEELSDEERQRHVLRKAQLFCCKADLHIDRAEQRRVHMPRKLRRMQFGQKERRAA